MANKLTKSSLPRCKAGAADAKRSKRRKRPADVIGNAVKVMRITVGEDTETAPDDGKNKAAQELGRMGGPARAKCNLQPVSLKFQSDILPMGPSLT
jgi:hypothetical protein